MSPPMPTLREKKICPAASAHTCHQREGAVVNQIHSTVIFVVPFQNICPVSEDAMER